MTKGIVLFFERGTPMWVQNVEHYGNTIRGFVKDGHIWIDYNYETRDLRVCTPQSGTVMWNTPINILRNMVVKCTIAVPTTIELTEHTDIVAWATTEKENNERTI